MSALAITGTILTNSSKRFINSISIGRKLTKHNKEQLMTIYLPMSSRRNEIQTAMDPGIRNESFTSYTDLFLQILSKLIINIFQYGEPTIVLHTLEC